MSFLEKLKESKHPIALELLRLEQDYQYSLGRPLANHVNEVMADLAEEHHAPALGQILQRHPKEIASIAKNGVFLLSADWGYIGVDPEISVHVSEHHAFLNAVEYTIDLIIEGDQVVNWQEGLLSCLKPELKTYKDRIAALNHSISEWGYSLRMEISSHQLWSLEAEEPQKELVELLWHLEESEEL